MLNLFQYDFVIKGLLAGLVIAIVAPAIGVFLVLRRYSLIADTLSHVSLAGIALGLLLGINPLLTAIGATTVSSVLIDKLNADYKAGLTSCKKNDIVTSHAAFGYLASDYGLTQVPIAGLSPDAEPSLREMASITNFIKTNGIKYVFFESLVSPKLSQTIADATGVQTLVLDPLEGLTPNAVTQGANYLTVMYQNLKNLRTALECQ